MCVWSFSWTGMKRGKIKGNSIETSKENTRLSRRMEEEQCSKEGIDEKRVDTVLKEWQQYDGNLERM